MTLAQMLFCTSKKPAKYFLRSLCLVGKTHREILVLQCLLPVQTLNTN